jgi:ribosomal protein S18 acetylase RimI-like enzyme
MPVRTKEMKSTCKLGKRNIINCKKTCAQMENIRKAKLSDKHSISEIAKNAGYIDYISENVTQMIEAGDLYVYEMNEIKGFLEAKSKIICWIGALRVDILTRRQGIARKLMKYAEELAISKNSRKMGALISPDNIASITLFRKEGFTKESVYIAFQGDVELKKIENIFPREEEILLNWEVINVSDLGNSLQSWGDNSHNVYLSNGKSLYVERIEGKLDIVKGERLFCIKESIFAKNADKIPDEIETWKFDYYTKRLY